MVSPVGRFAPSGATTVELVPRLLAAGTDPVAANNRRSATAEACRPPSRVRRHLAGHTSWPGL